MAVEEIEDLKEAMEVLEGRRRVYLLLEFKAWLKCPRTWVRITR